MGTLKNLICWSESEYLDRHGQNQNLQFCPDFCIIAQTAFHIGGDGGGGVVMVLLVVIPSEKVLPPPDENFLAKPPPVRVNRQND